MWCRGRSRGILCWRGLTSGAEERVCRRRKLRHGWCDLRFLPLRSSHLRRVLVQILCGRAALRHSIKSLRASSRSFEIVICVPVLLLVPGLSWRAHTQSHSSHLRCYVVHVLLALVHVLRRTRLRWKVASLLHRRVVLGWRTRVLTGGLPDGRAATLLIASRTGSNWWPPLIWLIFSAASVPIGRACTHGVIHGEFGHWLWRGVAAV
jgi:hypothetical protein